MDMSALKFEIKEMLCERLYLEMSPEELGDSDNLFAISGFDANGVFRSIDFWKFEVAAHPGELSEEQLRTPAGILEFIQARLNKIQQDKEPLISEITAAFDGVSREDGVTLHETEVIDAYGSAKERAEARKNDTENTWQGVPDKTIESIYGIGGLCFLDAKGLRYYLPAYMLWALKNINTTEHQAVIDGLINALELNPRGISGRLRILNPVQCRAVARFLEYVCMNCWCDNDLARKRLERHWKQYLNMELDPEPKPKLRGK